MAAEGLSCFSAMNIVVVKGIATVFGKYCDADDANVSVAAGSGGIGVGNAAETESSDFAMAFSEAVDFKRAVRVDDVAAFGEVSSFAVQNVETIDRNNDL